METNNLENLQKLGGKPSVFSCPECHGILWETRDGELLRFRCQVGHAYTADSMLADQSEALERALWAALRALEERSELMRRLAERTSKHNHRHASERFAQNVREAEQHATVIKGILEAGNYQEQSEDTGA